MSLVTRLTLWPPPSYRSSLLDLRVKGSCHVITEILDTLSLPFVMWSTWLYFDLYYIVLNFYIYFNLSLPYFGYLSFTSISYLNLGEDDETNIVRHHQRHVRHQTSNDCYYHKSSCHPRTREKKFKEWRVGKFFYRMVEKGGRGVEKEVLGESLRHFEEGTRKP